MSYSQTNFAARKMSTKPRVWRGQGRLFLYQRKIVLALNIGHVSDTSLRVYHHDHHEVLFHH